MTHHAAMDCPICRLPLVMSDRQGIEIDYCPQCRGVWLDRGELDKIVERSAAAISAAASVRAPASSPASPPAFGHQPAAYQKRRKSFLEDLFD